MTQFEHATQATKNLKYIFTHLALKVLIIQLL